MTKAELMRQLSWIKDDAELCVTVAHPTLHEVYEEYAIDRVAYRLLQPNTVHGRVEIVCSPHVQTDDAARAADAGERT